MRRSLVLVAAFPLLLAACEEPGAVPPPRVAESPTVGAAPLPASTLATPPVAPTSGPSAAAAPLPAPEPTPSPPPAPAPPPAQTPTVAATACQDPAMDLSSTALGAWLAAQVIPTGQPGASYSFEVVDNKFSPCADLSWAVLSGANVGPALEAGPPRDAVVFFRGAHLVTAPAPVQLPPGVTVDDHGDGSVQVSWEGAGRPPTACPGTGSRSTGSRQVHPGWISGAPAPRPPVRRGPTATPTPGPGIRSARATAPTR